MPTKFFCLIFYIKRKIIRKGNTSGIEPKPILYGQEHIRLDTFASGINLISSSFFIKVNGLAVDHYVAQRQWYDLRWKSSPRRYLFSRTLDILCCMRSEKFLRSEKSLSTLEGNIDKTSKGDIPPPRTFECKCQTWRDLDPSVVWICFRASMGYGGAMDSCGRCMKFSLICINIVTFVSIMLKHKVIN